MRLAIEKNIHPNNELEREKKRILDSMKKLLPFQNFSYSLRDHESLKITRGLTKKEKKWKYDAYYYDHGLSQRKP